MSKFANLKAGDLVRTTMEGKITSINDCSVMIRYRDDVFGNTIFSLDFPGLISVEKFEPPFAVGDVVYVVGGWQQREIKAIIDDLAWIKNLATGVETLSRLESLRRGSNQL